MNLKTRITFLFSVCCLLISNAQIEKYNFKQEVLNVQSDWHSIQLPNTIFKSVSSSFNDIRIYGLNGSDTIEVPYLLSQSKEQNVMKKIAFNRLNSSRNQNGHYFTLETQSNEPINQIELNFRQANFDWRVDIEGSQNQNEWFTITEDYRILSIQNSYTNYTFSKINLPNSLYKYYRVRVKTSAPVDLQNASISHFEKTTTDFNNYEVTHFNTSENKKMKQSVVSMSLKEKVPVSSIYLNINESIDYYRYFKVEYLADSLKVNDTWQPVYRELTRGTLSSMEDNVIFFNSTIVEHLKITIDNYDNEPLSIENGTVKGHFHFLIGRFKPDYNYVLVYGNKQAQKPNYDIALFSNKIPSKENVLSLGAITSIEHNNQEEVTKPLFENKAWLWGIIILIIVVLGFFSLKMLSAK